MEAVRDLDQEACYRAALTRDPRFDGRFFGCVRTTGIYCRPICPARTPRRENMFFVVSAAAAEERGFRACLRCRPETAPDVGAWRGTSNTVGRALALIEAGVLDTGEVDHLAQRLGVGERHLRRLFRQHLGASPISVAQTRRVLLAKALLHQTDLPMTQVALASGFGSVRRFNEAFQILYGRPPSALRRRREAASGPVISLRLPYRAPYDWPSMMTALRRRGDRIEGRRWSRRLDRTVDGADGIVRVAPGMLGCVEVQWELDDLRALPGVLSRVRRVFDLGADPQAIASDLSADPELAPLVAQRPGLRVPGLWLDPLDEPTSDRLSDPALADRAERWRPWRAYGELHLTWAGSTGAAKGDEDARPAA
jgi:AraC family transcriptional regulator of adaptative response / DNA-3-methyladenine glycosylase II